MRKLLLIIGFLGLNLSLKAHNAQISTLSVVQNEDKKWRLIVSSGLSAFEFELRNKFPTLDLNTLKLNDFQKLFLANIKENISIEANGGNAIELINGSIKIGHQTDARFDLSGMPDELEEFSISNQSFSTLTDHHYVINIITKKGSSQNFVLEKNNNFELALASENDTWKVAEKHDTGFYIAIASSTLSLLIIIIVMILKKNKAKKRLKFDVQGSAEN